jgi:hypothetical protein
MYGALDYLGKAPQLLNRPQARVIDVGGSWQRKHVGVTFNNNDLDTPASEETSQYHPDWSEADDRHTDRRHLLLHSPGLVQTQATIQI